VARESRSDIGATAEELAGIPLPSTNVAVDEAMMRCTGRSRDTYKMPNKPIQRGYKFHCLADHGYVWDFHPTSNQCGPDPVPSIEGLTATGEVVYHLCCKLPRARYWVVYLDNLYTSVPLLARLRHNSKRADAGRLDPAQLAFLRNSKTQSQRLESMGITLARKRFSFIPFSSWRLGFCCGSTMHQSR
jgi:hypothetical protein